MARLWSGAALALAFTVGACGDEAEPQQERRSIKIENPHHDQLSALSQDMQHLGLMRAIRDNGNRCKRVDAASYQEDYRGMAMWVARCSEGRDWAVFISPNGDIQVRACTETQQLELPECRLEEGGTAAEPARNEAG